MDGTRLQALIYRGRGKAAARVGLPCRVFRPQNSTAPLTNLLTTIPAAFNAADSKYGKPSLYGKAVWYADLDGRITKTGDYLVRIKDGATWFIAGQQEAGLPIVAVDCNGLISIQRPTISTQCGVVGYSGVQNPGDILGTVDSPWPASILIGGRTQAAIGLPSDVKEAGWRILLPPSIPKPILAGDFVTDDIGRRFAVESGEVTDLGWRLTANEVHA